MKKLVLTVSLFVSSFAFAEGWVQGLKSKWDSLEIISPLSNMRLEYKAVSTTKDFMSQIGNSQRLDNAKTKAKLAQELKRWADEEAINSILSEGEGRSPGEKELMQMKLLFLRASAQSMVLISRGPRIIEVADGEAQEKENVGVCRGRTCQVRHYKVRPYLTASVTLDLACREVPEKEPKNTTCKVKGLNFHEPYVVLGPERAFVDMPLAESPEEEERTLAR